jgi:hypothetical protein
VRKHQIQVPSYQFGLIFRNLASIPIQLEEALEPKAEIPALHVNLPQKPGGVYIPGRSYTGRIHAPNTRPLRAHSNR